MKLLFVLAVSPLALVMADAAEQDTVNRCATIIREFQQMAPRKQFQETNEQNRLAILFPLFMANLCKIFFVFSERTTIMRPFSRQRELPITSHCEASTMYSPSRLL